MPITGYRMDQYGWIWQITNANPEIGYVDLALPMELIWFEDYLALAETLNFSRAAEARHVTQPAFSRRIRALEAWIGAELFTRTTHGVALTPDESELWISDQVGKKLFIFDATKMPPGQETPRGGVVTPLARRIGRFKRCSRSARGTRRSGSGQCARRPTSAICSRYRWAWSHFESASAEHVTRPARLRYRPYPTRPDS
jgi:hypothetical protein